MTFSLLALCLSTVSAFAQTPVQPALREDVRTTVAEAVRVLEAKDYETFLAEFLPPELAESRAGSPEDLAAWAQEFSGRAPALLAALKSIMTQTPTVDEAGTTATYRLTLEGGPPTLRFVKLGRYWYFGER